MNICLLIVDVQNGFISQETKHILPRLEHLCESNLINHIYLTQFKNDMDGPYRRILKWSKLSTDPELEIYSPLKKYAEKIFKKSTYTSVSNDFVQIIKNNQIDAILIAGIDTDCCVLTTAADLFQLNIIPIVLTEYCASNGGSLSHNSAIVVLKRLIGEDQIYDEIVDKNGLKDIYEIVNKAKIGDIKYGTSS